MKKIASGVAAIVLCVAAQSATAREFADIYTECGLGAMIAPTNPPVAAITNVTWDLGTTAISSDATTADSCKGGKEKTASFIYETYPQLEKDLAQGEGEYLNALMAMTGCDSDAQTGLVKALRGDLSDALSNGSYSNQSHFKKVEGLHQKLHERMESDFAQSCNIG